MLPDSFMHFYDCCAWLKNGGTKTKNTQHTSTIVLFLSGILLSPFTLFHVVYYPFSPRGVILFSRVFFPGASLDQFTKSTSWEQYNLAKGTIFLVMKSLRGLADVTGFAGRIFAKLEKGQFRVNPNPLLLPFPVLEKAAEGLSGHSDDSISAVGSSSDSNVFLKPSIQYPPPLSQMMYSFAFLQKNGNYFNLMYQ
jgi:hypothetical protein